MHGCAFPPGRRPRTIISAKIRLYLGHLHHAAAHHIYRPHHVAGDECRVAVVALICSAGGSRRGRSISCAFGLVEVLLRAYGDGRSGRTREQRVRSMITGKYRLPGRFEPAPAPEPVLWKEKRHERFQHHTARRRFLTGPPWAWRLLLSGCGRPDRGSGLPAPSCVRKNGQATFALFPH